MRRWRAAKCPECVGVAGKEEEKDNFRILEVKRREYSGEKNRSPIVNSAESLRSLQPRNRCVVSNSYINWGAKYLFYLGVIFA